jgi:hypothetical protein
MHGCSIPVAKKNTFDLRFNLLIKLLQSLLCFESHAANAAGTYTCIIVNLSTRSDFEHQIVAVAAIHRTTEQTKRVILQAVSFFIS